MKVYSYRALKKYFYDRGEEQYNNSVVRKLGIIFRLLFSNKLSRLELTKVGKYFIKKFEIKRLLIIKPDSTY